ncbi:hypothetical protein ACFPES_27395 [Paenibacillus sp. GCM10023248]|uniref:hypothetical protein n=1 Tax=unclassified Paenibacillus TaxID=185978 RepID=UPI00237836A0|nr:hypothetical protein [Paenibacillus sp. MAHUQ-63]MDD9270788.1 hypothetical protein [Paenibacillus sp. MAHUQ-63]
MGRPRRKMLVGTSASVRGELEALALHFGVDEFLVVAPVATMSCGCALMNAGRLATGFSHRACGNMIR